jgi:hypothetical protein
MDEEIVDLNSFKKISSIGQECLFLSTSNVGLFLNIFHHVHASIFHGLVTG